MVRRAALAPAVRVVLGAVLGLALAAAVLVPAGSTRNASAATAEGTAAQAVARVDAGSVTGQARERFLVALLAVAVVVAVRSPWVRRRAVARVRPPARWRCRDVAPRGPPARRSSAPRAAW